MLQLPKLETLDFRSNLFPIEFIAWICANYPHIKGYCLKPYAAFCDGTGIICGKRKPSIDDIESEKGQKMIYKAVKNFAAMTSRYKGWSFEQIIDEISNKK